MTGYLTSTLSSSGVRRFLPYARPSRRLSREVAFSFSHSSSTLRKCEKASLDESSICSSERWNYQRTTTGRQVQHFAAP